MTTTNEIMSKDVVFVDAESLVLEAVKIMDDKEIGSVVVKLKDGAMGIFTERDLVTKVLSKDNIPNLSSLKIKDVMTTDLIIATPEQSLLELVDSMKEKNIRHIPVVKDIPVVDHNCVVGILSIRDILWHNVEELEKSIAHIRESAQQMIQAEKMAGIGEIAAGVAHEMNQPLNVIKITVQSVLKDIEKDRFDQETAKEDLPEILVQVNRLSEIINHMRVFTRKTEGTSEVSLDINELIKTTFTFLGQQLINHNIEIFSDYAEGLPKFKGDAIRLEQVFMNLITNARHALESCGKEDMKIETKTYASKDLKHIVAEIKDNGPGIPAEDQKKIFESFFTTKEEGKGTGLGLSVVKRIVKEHDGQIEVESTVGEGTTFRLTFPAVQ